MACAASEIDHRQVSTHVAADEWGDLVHNSLDVWRIAGEQQRASKQLKISGHEHIVKIPVLVNESIIKPGEELLLFVEKEEIVKPPTVVQGLQLKAVKRTKVASS